MELRTHTSMDAQFLERALDGADLNALRLALYQLTGDESLSVMKTEIVPIRGGGTLAPRQEGVRPPQQPFEPVRVQLPFLQDEPKRVLLADDPGRIRQLLAQVEEVYAQVLHG
jgi:hypothetical protein